LYIYIIIIIGMNVVDNLNSVKVINKPCMSSRCMSLLPRTTLHSDSAQVPLCNGGNPFTNAAGGCPVPSPTASEGNQYVSIQFPLAKAGRVLAIL
jgi:hypothetical protein